jgi:hypothetical protein
VPPPAPPAAPAPAQLAALALAPAAAAVPVDDDGRVIRLTVVLTLAPDDRRDLVVNVVRVEDGLTRLLVDVAGERMALLGRPSLLISGFATAVPGEWCGRAGPLGVVRF